MRKLTFSAVAFAALLTACGGGGGSSPTPSSSLQTGFFIDAAVSGLGFSTPTQSGTTGSDGSFQYLNGETVTFSLFGQELQSPLGFRYVTPFDLSDSSIDPAYSINLVRFLMAIDEDGIPSNGIQLPAYSGTLNINFNQSILSFGSDLAVATAISDIKSGATLPTVEAAVTHFNDSLSNIAPDYTVSFAGRTASSIITDFGCPTGQGGWSYTFTTDTVTLSGTDSVDKSFYPADPTSLVSCTWGVGGVSGATETISDNFSELFVCQGGSVCTYRELNTVRYVPNDPDGRVAVEWTWHTPNTNTIIIVKSILEDIGSSNHPGALSTFKEIITLN